MQFQVPQFIETDTKVVGPFTLKQFLFVAAGAIIIFMMRYIFSSMFLWVVASLPVAALALGLAYYKIDGIPLYRYITMAVGFAFGSKKYIYKKEEANQSDDIDQFIDQYGKPTR
jgi:hypothetical protein